jgi:hypothetical protein
VLRHKVKEWNELFGDGVNNDDDFKIGLFFRNGENTKLTSQNGATPISATATSSSPLL